MTIKTTSNRTVIAAKIKAGLVSMGMMLSLSRSCGPAFPLANADPGQGPHGVQGSKALVATTGSAILRGKPHLPVPPTRASTIVLYRETSRDRGWHGLPRTETRTLDQGQ